MKRTSFLLAFLVPFCSYLPAQSVPPLINYQGQLFGPGGTNLPTADYTLMFSIYETAQGGTPIWGPQIFNGQSGPGYGPKIPVVQGYFNVMLGPKDTAERPLAEAFASYPRYVEIKVGSNPAIAPRQQILSAPYAMRAAYAPEAGNAQTVQGNSPGDFVSKSGDTMTGTLVVPANGFAASGNQLVLANNNVGIGVPSPNERLEVFGTIMTRASSSGASALILASTAPGGQRFEWYNDFAGVGSGILALYNRTQGNSPIAFTPSGNVGIGTYTPQAKLDVVGTMQLSGGESWTDSHWAVRFKSPLSSVWRSTTTDQAGKYLGFGMTDHGWYFLRSTAADTSAPAEAPVVIRNTGQLGIGTTVPTEALHVVGSIMTEGTGGGGRIILKGTAAGGHQYEWYPDSPSAGDMGLFDRTANAYRMVVKANGTVGIGRFPTTYRLEVEGNALKTAGGSAWATSSDVRIKQDVATVESALETLNRVRLVSFRYTDEYRQAHPSVQDRRYLNVVAQEFAEVFPDAVSGSGERLSDGHEILAVDIHPLTIYSAAAIQELNQRLKAKETQVSNLEKRVADLEKLVRLLAAKMEGASK